MHTIDSAPIRRASATATDSGPTTPERLHAQALATCLWHAVTEAAGRLELAPGEFRVEVEAQFAPSLNGEYSLEVVGTVGFPEQAGLTGDDQRRLLREADRLWPYTSGNWGRIAVRVGLAD